MGITHWVRTYATSGGWNGTLGFRSEAAAVNHARRHVTTFPGSRAEVHTDACMEQQSREQENVPLFVPIDL